MIKKNFVRRMYFRIFWFILLVSVFSSILFGTWSETPLVLSLTIGVSLGLILFNFIVMILNGIITILLNIDENMQKIVDGMTKAEGIDNTQKIADVLTKKE